MQLLLHKYFTSTIRLCVCVCVCVCGTRSENHVISVTLIFKDESGTEKKFGNCFLTALCRANAPHIHTSKGIHNTLQTVCNRLTNYLTA